MGLNIRQFFGDHVPHPQHAGLLASDRQHLSDVERIAAALAEQAGAPSDEWPFFVEPAESLIRLSRRWTEGC
jgi:hypothetical protein